MDGEAAVGLRGLLSGNEPSSATLWRGDPTSGVELYGAFYDAESEPFEELGFEDVLLAGEYTLEARVAASGGITGGGQTFTGEFSLSFVVADSEHPIPEPGTLGLSALWLAGLGMARRRHQGGGRRRRRPGAVCDTGEALSAATSS